MRKKLVMILAAALVMSALGGCGSDEPENKNTESSQEDTLAEVTASDTERVNLSDLNLSDYVVLADYQQLEATVQPIEVTDEEVDEQALSLYRNYVTEDNGGILDRAVAEGDTVIIDYEGKKDDVAFDGGTAQGASLNIGSGEFIAGFEDGLIGVLPGETVDLNLTFPEGYGGELSGADVVFTVTVHYILPKEMQDEVIAGFETQDFQNIEELKQYARTLLEEDAQEEYEQNVEAAVVEALVAQCTFQELPEELIAQYEQTIMENMQMWAYLYGMDADTLTYYMYGTDLATYAAEGAPESARQILAAHALAEREGLLIPDEALEERLEELASENGWESVEEFLQQYDKEEIRESLIFQDVLDYLVENTVILPGETE